MGALRMEPLVAQQVQFAILLQAGILVVDGVNQCPVVAAEVYFGYGQVQVADEQILQVQLLYLPLQLLLAPQEVVVLAAGNTGDGLHGRMAFQGELQRGVLGHRVAEDVALAYHDHLARLYVAQRVDGRGIGTPHGFQLEGFQYGSRQVVVLLTKHVGRGYDDVGLPLDKVLLGQGVLLHDEGIGTVHLVKNGAQQVNRVASRPSVVVKIFVGRHVPVADDDQGLLWPGGLGSRCHGQQQGGQ